MGIVVFIVVHLFSKDTWLNFTVALSVVTVRFKNCDAWFLPSSSNCAGNKSHSSTEPSTYFIAANTSYVSPFSVSP